MEQPTKIPKELTVGFRVNPAEKHYLRFAASVDEFPNLSSWMRSVIANYIETKYVSEEDRNNA